MSVRLRPLIKPDGRISRIRLSESSSSPTFALSDTVRVDDFTVAETYPLAGPSASVAPDIQTSIPPSLRTHYRRFFATTRDSDFQANACRLTGRTGLCVRLSLDALLAHRPGPPRLSDACLPDVLTTLTPTEFAGYGDWVSCKHRPSHNTPEARRLRAFNITRLIRCGSSSFRPVGSMPGLLNPLQPCGWTGTWPFRREPPNSTGGTLTHEQRTLRGLLRGDLSIEPAPAPSLYCSSAARRPVGPFPPPAALCSVVASQQKGLHFRPESCSISPHPRCGLSCLGPSLGTA